MATDFEQITVNELAFLIEQYGFKVVESDEHHVRFESRTLWVEVWDDPRGEIDLTVQRLGSEKGYGKVEYVGMLGTAPKSRVIHLLAQRLRRNEQALNADAAYFDELEVDQQRASREWTDYYSRATEIRPTEARFE